MSELDGSRAFGALVRAHRQRLGLTQEELATKAGLSVRSIVKLEGGRIAVPRPPTVRLLAVVFGLTGSAADDFRRCAAGVTVDPAAGLPPAGRVPADGGRVPAQLPPDVSTFTGRETQLAALDAMAAATADQPTAAFVAVVTGPAGVGKTALALRWAHHVRDRFPGGQLYVNLRGYDPAQPVTAADALARFLTALGVAAQDIPVDVDDRAARFRTETADRRVLLLLDNASSVEQVRPLLPGTASCAALVTSRDTLPGLVAVDGAHRVEVDLLPPGDANALLRRLIGTRARAEANAVATLAEQCARLPLALRVAAELVVARPDATLADLVTELHDQRRRLTLLAAGDDPRASVSAVLSWSLRHLPPAAAHAFGLLGLHPGPDLDTYAAASLTGGSPAEARTTLEVLARAHLVHRTGPNRYGMHDLLRAYAAEQAERPVDAPRTRLFDHYLAAATTAMNVLFPTDAVHCPASPPPAAVPPPGAAPPPGTVSPPSAVSPSGAVPVPSSVAAPSSGAVPVLPPPEGVPPFGAVSPSGAVPSSGAVPELAVSDRAPSSGAVPVLPSSVAVPALASSVAVPPVPADRDAARAWLDGERAALLAIVAQTATDGWPFHAVQLSSVLLRYLAGGQPADAVTVHGHALDAARATGDLAGEAQARTALGAALLRLGRTDTAAEQLERATALFADLGDPAGEARAHVTLGLVALRLSRLAAAAAGFETALRLFVLAGDRAGEARALNNLGLVEERMGRYGPAEEHCLLALALYQEAGNLLGEASTLTDLGIIEYRLGRHEEAAGHHRRALTLFLDGHDRIGEAWARNGLGEAARSLGDPSGALTHHAAALAAATIADARDQQARAHRGLGDAHEALHDLTRAGAHHEQAVALYTELGMPEGDDLRARLAAAPPAPAPRP
ncbi:tetratricopeptide repeat protein [Dactylosporangium sp. NPDC049525]|uniref:ATP-binding protein n=1 Tax=Dactylosporangium sp. NPDC049525 TaxID=3154730 RepID=UPI003443C58E